MDSSVEEVYLFGIPYDKLPTYKRKSPVGNEPTAVEETLNVELLLEIFKFIKEHPLTWRQETWYAHVDRGTGQVLGYGTREEEFTDSNVCGTSFCFAGHVALREGFPFPPLAVDGDWEREVVYDDGWEDVESASDFAAARLGLSFRQATILFNGNNSIEVIEFLVRVFMTEPDISAYLLGDIIYDIRQDFYEEEYNPEKAWEDVRYYFRRHGDVALPPVLVEIP